MYFKVVMEIGQQGTEKASDMVRYFAAEDISRLLKLLKDYRALNSKESGMGIKLIKPVTLNEYRVGRAGGNNNPFDGRSVARLALHAFCLIEPKITGPDVKSLVGTTINYSEGGICVQSENISLRKGSSHRVSVKTLDTVRKDAEVIWTMPVSHQSTLVGFKWL